MLLKCILIVCVHIFRDPYAYSASSPYTPGAVVFYYTHIFLPFSFKQTCGFCSRATRYMKCAIAYFGFLYFRTLEFPSAYRPHVYTYRVHCGIYYRFMLKPVFPPSLTPQSTYTNRTRELINFEVAVYFCLIGDGALARKTNIQ